MKNEKKMKDLKMNGCSAIQKMNKNDPFNIPCSDTCELQTPGKGSHFFDAHEFLTIELLYTRSIVLLM
jgi:hypothetical protein